MTTSEARRYQNLRAHLGYLKLNDAADALNQVLDAARSEGLSLRRSWVDRLRSRGARTCRRSSASRTSGREGRCTAETRAKQVPTGRRWSGRERHWAALRRRPSEAVVGAAADRRGVADSRTRRRPPAAGKRCRDASCGHAWGRTGGGPSSDDPRGGAPGRRAQVVHRVGTPPSPWPCRARAYLADGRPAHQPSCLGVDTRGRVSTRTRLARPASAA